MCAHEHIWRTWSANQRSQLIALPIDALVLAIKTRKLEDLTEDDQAAVLEHLANKAGPRAVETATGAFVASRVPATLKGANLPCGPVQQRALPFKTLLIVLGLAGWAICIAIGLHAIKNGQTLENLIAP